MQIDRFDEVIAKSVCTKQLLHFSFFQGEDGLHQKFCRQVSSHQGNGKMPHLSGTAPLSHSFAFKCFVCCLPTSISRSCHLLWSLSCSVAGGWLRLTFPAPDMMSVCVCGFACSFLFACQCTPCCSPYFQSTLFKDQRRSWWLIFLFIFFHLLGKREREGSKLCEVEPPRPPHLFPLELY